MKARAIVASLLLATCVILLAACAPFTAHKPGDIATATTTPAPIANPTSSSTTTESSSAPRTPTPGALLARASFASAVVQEYPRGWPDNLRLPAEWHLVEATSAKLTNGRTGWSAKLTYDKDAKTAVASLVAILEQNGWKCETRDLGANGALVLMELPGKNTTGTAVVGPAPQGTAARIILTVLG